jgi:hypothetical protein
MNIETASRTYKFTEEYTTTEGKVETAVVLLKVDEVANSFEVIPGDRMSGFVFSGRMSHKSFAKWSAVAKLVYMAVEFAIKDLKLAQPEESVVEEAVVEEPSSDGNVSE